MSESGTEFENRGGSQSGCGEEVKAKLEIRYGYLMEM